MVRYELKLPKMGESVAEATLTNWLKEVGEVVEADEPIVEIATDKVDSEVPCEVEGVLVKRFFEVDDVVQVGEVIAIIEAQGDDEEPVAVLEKEGVVVVEEPVAVNRESISQLESSIAQASQTATSTVASKENRFYSPLVKNIAQQEGINQEELDGITGSGLEGRVTKDDILAYVGSRKAAVTAPVLKEPKKEEVAPVPVSVSKTPTSVNGESEIIEMTRMGKLISKHMVESLQKSAHVQSFIEVDVTRIVNWRNAIKSSFEKREGEKITFTPIFMEAVAKTIRDFPMINISVEGDKVIKHKNINLGMAAALADGNLIVPVIKNADQLNLVGMTKMVNDLAKRARIGQLKPDDTQGGTYTVTNVGSFGSVMGTPIINQPQVAILALGAIRKVPAVIETPDGDFIGIRHKMFLSHSYDHRVVNGAMGGQFIQRIAQYLEEWDVNREL